MGLFGLTKSFIQKVSEHVDMMVSLENIKQEPEKKIIEEVEYAIENFKDEIKENGIFIKTRLSVNEAKELNFSADLFGYGNIPDISFQRENGKKYAIEFKRVDSSADIKSLIGQAIVYSTLYDSVLIYLVDESKGEKIKANSDGEKEKQLISTLWNKYKVKLEII